MSYFKNIIQEVYPRILTQVNRDPNSSTFGSFDRNWWHYKIRDFSSIILQQGGYFLYTLSQQKEFEQHQDFLKNIAKGSVDFWVNRSFKRGAFEEYYPWENAYPPLAFATLAMAKIIEQEKLQSKDISNALKLAAHKLQNRFESRAGNQQIAGLAALSVIRKHQPNMVSEQKWEAQVQKTLALQDEEGWYMEYDGPDLGYLSVSLDCLWDLYDYSEDKRFLDSALRAFNFIADIVIKYQRNIGMHNSRNTDYIVPYGIARFVHHNEKKTQAKAIQLLQILYEEVDKPHHFFKAVDDRYWSHYIGHSVARAEQILEGIDTKVETTKIELPNPLYYPNAGYQIIDKNKYQIFINAKKGGLISVTKDQQYIQDMGWIVMTKKKQYVNHWWDANIDADIAENEIQMKAHLVGHSDTNSSPLKHMALRILSFVFGHHIISFLKNQLIFKNAKSPYSFERKIYLKDNEIQISDKISKLKGDEEIISAPRFSKRHVASADSYHIEDAHMNHAFNIKTENHIQKNIFIAQKNIHL